jgi:hypothetical protein
VLMFPIHDIGIKKLLLLLFRSVKIDSFFTQKSVQEHVNTLLPIQYQINNKFW